MPKQHHNRRASEWGALADFLLGSKLNWLLLLVLVIVLAVLTLALVSGDGESNWLEGVELLALYLVLAIIFYFVPGAGV